jgi:hypothetical protein
MIRHQLHEPSFFDEFWHPCLHTCRGAKKAAEVSYSPARLNMYVHGHVVEKDRMNPESLSRNSGFIDPALFTLFTGQE